MKDYFVLRNYGLDLGKMFAMLGVVVLHTLLMRGNLATIELTNVDFYISWFFETLFYGSVDIFAMITGYLMWNRRAKISSALYIYIQVFVTVLICLLVACYQLPLQVDKSSILEAICPPLFGHSTYWYIASYLFMYMFIPIMNFAIQKMRRTQHLYLLFVLMFAFCILPYFVRMDNLFLLQQYSPLLLMAMYFFGAYAGKYPPRKYVRAHRYLLYAMLCISGTYALTIGYDFYLATFKDVTAPNYRYVSYTAPLVVMASYYFVRFFANLKTSMSIDRFLRKYSVATFGVYVIHCDYFVYTFLFSVFCRKFFPVAGPYEFLMVFIIVFVTFFACLFLDRVRFLLFELFQVRQFCESVDRKLTNRIKNRFGVIQ